MKALLLAFLLLSSPCFAQDKPVVKWADWSSYGTAAVNPTWAATDAWRGPHRSCHLAQLGISEAVGNLSALTIKHFVHSPRPCLGCPADGMPSGHTLNAFIGISTHWKRGAASAGGTALLRVLANRHTWAQVGAGAALGIASDYAGHLLKCAS